MIIGYLLVCGPLAVTIVAWIKLYRARKQEWPRFITLFVLTVTTAISAFAAGMFVYCNLHPTNLPPWQDPRTILALLSVLSPMGLIFVYAAEKRGAPRWLVLLLAIALATLFIDGILVSIAV